MHEFARQHGGFGLAAPAGWPNVDYCTEHDSYMSAIIGLAIACFKGGKGAKDGGFWTYKTTKTITYDVWQLGLTNRVLQACIAIYVVLYLYLFQAGWAYGERPMGSFNAWSEGGGSGTIIKAASSLDSSFVYCGNASYSYEWAPGWNYGEPPVCRKLNKNEATTKGVNDLFFTTIYIEYHVRCAPRHRPPARPARRVRPTH